jgi:cystathionine beta-lyase/cystathionine gamma-synthase
MKAPRFGVVNAEVNCVEAASRLSVGIEDVEDLIADLNQALSS